MKLLQLATLIAWMSPAVVLAQDSSAPSAPSAQVAPVRAGVAALGRQWDEEVKAQTAQLYAAIQRPHPPSGIRELRGTRYGADRRQTLDLYYPGQGFDELGPVIIFLYGDAEAHSDRSADQAANALYANSARSLARFGGVGINASYRHAPGANWPSGANDVRAVVQWAHRNVARYGGDPASIIVLGSGEGAMHLATYLFQPTAQPEDGPGIAGAILGSGTFANWPLNLIESYQGKAVPILMWSAEYDPLESGVVEMRDKLCQKYGACPMFVQLAGHNHASPLMSIDSLDVSVAGAIIRFYHTAVRK